MKIVLRWIELTVISAATLWPPMVHAQTERSDASPVMRITGRVEQVYSAERRVTDDLVDALFAIEVRIWAVEGSEDVAVGDVVFVRAWQRVKPPDGAQEPAGQSVIPDRGDVARTTILAAGRRYDAVEPDGIEILLAETWRSDSTGLNMVLLEPGDYEMGGRAQEPDATDDEPAHPVQLTRPFYLGRYEVTQAEYQQVMKLKPSAFAVGGASRDKVSRLVTDRFPVENVTWFDAVEFCNRLSLRDGLSPYYDVAHSANHGETAIEPKVVVLGGDGYRLPTEAEWEYACRAGTTTPFHFGFSSKLNRANCRSKYVKGGFNGNVEWKSLGRTAKVGSYPPNAWGLFDMHGNVAEWCQDWYDENWYRRGKAGEASIDPQGPETGEHKVLRGGSWLLPETQCRSASRMFHLPREAKDYGGFRVARTPSF